jgi:hypothetical protein
VFISNGAFFKTPASYCEGISPSLFFIIYIKMGTSVGERVFKVNRAYNGIPENAGIEEDEWKLFRLTIW